MIWKHTTCRYLSKLFQYGRTRAGIWQGKRPGVLIQIIASWGVLWSFINLLENTKHARNMNTLKFQWYLGKVLYSSFLRNDDPGLYMLWTQWGHPGYTQIDKTLVSDHKETWDESPTPRETINSHWLVRSVGLCRDCHLAGSRSSGRRKGIAVTSS